MANTHCQNVNEAKIFVLKNFFKALFVRILKINTSGDNYYGTKLCFYFRPIKCLAFVFLLRYV